MQPDLRCYYHPDREATSQCDRCGDYLCGECVLEWKEQMLCDTCYRELRPVGRTLAQRFFSCFSSLLFILSLIVVALLLIPLIGAVIEVFKGP